MAILTKEKLDNLLRGKRILWISFLILDLHFHKTAQLEILRHLAKRGHNTSLVAMYSKSKIQNENLQVRIISVPLRYIPLISPIIFTIMLFFFLPFYIIIMKPDYVITDPNISIFGFISALPFSKLRRIKLLLDVRSTPVEIVGIRRFLESLCFTASIHIAKKFFNGITIVTPLMKEEVCKRFNLNLKFVEVWSNGVNMTLFDPAKYFLKELDLRRKLGFNGKFVIFYHGAFTATRGLMETVEAMSIIKRMNPNVVLLLLGSGPINHSLRSLIRKKGLQDIVVIHNPVEYTEVPSYIAVADVGIVPLPNHPYWRFQCPLNLLEYLAMNKVVIASDIPANRIIIGNRECGVYFATTNPAEIARCIMYTYENRGILQKWGAIGRTIVNRKYTWEKVAKDLENYLLSIDAHKLNEAR
jgi:glycosyltransferase involved in cell wall biosynthesis